MSRKKTALEQTAERKAAYEALPLPDAEWCATFDEKLNAIVQPELEKQRRQNARGKELANGADRPPHYVRKKYGPKTDI